MSTSDLAIKNLATPKSESTNMSVREVTEPPGAAAKPAKKGVRFWLIFLAVCMSLFLSAMDFTAVSTTLPTIVNDLNGEDFVWVASAYALASTALLPASGAMAQVFGRRITILSAIALFALGSALCGAAQSMNWLIAARTVQGAGGGAILCTASIIVSDLVPLNERALYNGFIGFTWAIAAIVGPLVGGALAQEGQWRWLFYLNLPICGVSAALVAFFLNLKTPRGSFWSKISRMDWIGNFLVIGSSSAVIIALSWGGVKFSWSSANVLAPLLIGLAGLALFLLYDGMIAKEPLVPFSIISNRTSLSGYLQTLISPIAQVGTLYFMPVYYQACYGSTPIQSGAYLLSFLAVAGLFLVLSAVTVTVTQRYRPQLWFGWACCVANAAALSTLDADSPKSASIGYPVFMGLATGTIFAIAYFPVLAPLDVSQNARALSFFAFCRSFGNVWAVAIGTAVLQTQLTLRLPADFVDKLPKGVALFYTVIPQIAGLNEPLRTTVRVAYADSLRVFWQVMIGISGIGFLSSLMMKGLPLHKKVDDKWGMEKKTPTPQRRMTIASEEMQLTELPRDEA